MSDQPENTNPYEPSKTLVEPDDKKIEPPFFERNLVAGFFLLVFVIVIVWIAIVLLWGIGSMAFELFTQRYSG